MKKANILVCMPVFQAAVLFSQNDFGIPKAQICFGAGLFGFDSYDQSVYACKTEDSYRPAGLFLLEYRIHKNIAIDIKSSFYKTVHHYGNAISDIGDKNDQSLRFCFKEFHNV
jgi:hypothetical protein